MKDNLEFFVVLRGRGHALFGRVRISFKGASLQELSGNVTACETLCTASSGEHAVRILKVGSAAIVVIAQPEEGGALRERERGSREQAAAPKCE